MSDARKLVLTENISANGVVEFLDPWFDPGDDGNNDDQLEVLMAQSAAQGAILLGRQTFEEFRGYWPLQTDDTTGITAHLNQVPKYVYSATMTDPEWEHSTVLSGPLVDEVRALKAQSGGEIGVTGSITLVHALLETDLIDEIRLFVYPVLTSNGRNLVPRGLSMQPLRLSGNQRFRSGVLLQTYTRA